MKALRLRQLRKEVLAATQAVAMMPPVRLGDYLYSDVERGNFLAQVRVPACSPGAVPQLLVDPNLEHGGSDVVGIGPMSVSHDGRRLAFLRDRSGSEAFEVVARWIDSGEPIALPRLDGVAKAVEWDASGRFLYVSLTQSRDDVMWPCRVVVVDTETQTWRTVAEEADPSFMLELGATKDRQFIRLGRLAYDCTEQWIVPEVGAAPVLMRPRQAGRTYTIEHLRGDEWIVFSQNALFRTDSFHGEWNLLHRDLDMAVADVDCFATRCLLFGYRKSVPCIASVDLSGRREARSIDIPSVTIVAPRPNLDISASVANVMMASPVLPPFPATLDGDMQLHGMPQGGSAVETLVTLETSLPITVVRGDPRKPCLLHVYGAYGAITAPEYEPLLQPLLARGWTAAFAHVRGGGMMGPEYVRDKRQCVEDLNECARRVAGLCSGVVLRAASAGAFTAAAALLSGQRYRAALLEVPFLNAYEELTARSKSALSQFELREWGDLETLKQLDPTMQLRQGRGAETLPPLLLTCSEADARVAASSVLQFAELAKARGARVQVLKTEGGHGGDGGLVSSAKHAAQLLDFLLSV